MTLHAGPGQRQLLNPTADTAGPRPAPLPPVAVFAIFNGTPGNDTIAGTNNADTFNMDAGGDDSVAGRNGDDIVNFGAELTAADAVDGGLGTDNLILDGNYSGGLAFAAGTMRNVEIVTLKKANSYFLTLDNANVLLEQQLTIDGSKLLSADSMIFDGSDETSSRLSLIGGDGNDQIVGGGARDAIDPGAGNDLVDGGAGDDQIFMGKDFTGLDGVDGGAGFDLVSLLGDYSAGLVLGLNTLRNVEALSLLGPDAYNVTVGSNTLSPNETLLVDCRAHLDSASVTLNALAVTDSDILFLGGAEKDIVTIGQSGRDVLRTGDGNDEIVTFQNLTETVRIDGGLGSDTVRLNGDYLDRLQFDSRTIRNVELIELSVGSDYNLALADGNTAAGDDLIVVLSTGAGDRLFLDASDESNGQIIVSAGNGDDRFIGGGGDDLITAGSGANVIDFSHGGTDQATAGGGADTFIMGAALDNSDVINAGAGSDTIFLDGNYGSGSFNLSEFESVRLASGNNYNLDASTSNTFFMTVFGNHLGAGDVLDFNGLGFGRYQVAAGAGDDIIRGADRVDLLTGNAGDDKITGRGDGDSLSGGKGADTFVYAAVSDSTSIDFDTIAAVNFSEDKFDVAFAVTGIDSRVTTGTLSDTSQATFDANIAAAINAFLGAQHAILFEPDAGTLAGDAFMIVDANGTGSYESGSDLVIDVTGETGNVLDTGDFI
jgi:Ca2+-binding RTX toxin-like protein